MPASYRTDDGRFEVIRPLIECAEAEIAAFAAELAFPIIPCNLCGSQDGLKRDAMTRLLADLERDNPNVRAVMLNALRNVRPTHLLDREVARAWAERDPEIRPAVAPEPRTRHAAAEPAQTLRAETRRRAREQEAFAMNQLLSTGTGAGWEQIAPHLDAALGALKEPERDAVLLRYFERKSAREMAQLLGIGDDAAQKRVSRGVERLREYLAKRGVAVGAGGLVVLISSNAVQSAPAGLAVSVSSAALAGTALTSTAIGTATKLIAMTTLHKAIIGATLVAGVGLGIHEARRASALADRVAALQQQQAPLNEQIQELTRQVEALREDNNRLISNAGLNNYAAQSAQPAVGPRIPHQEQRPQRAASAQAPAKPVTAGKTSWPEEEAAGRDLGAAIVRGEPGALAKLADLARASAESFKTNSIGLTNEVLAALWARRLAPTSAAFKVIEDACVQGNQVAMDALVQALQLRELQPDAMRCLGALGARGNDDALEVLLNSRQYGLPLSSTVPALRAAAENGNQKAIDYLSAVTSDQTSPALWFMAASGLSKAAAAGNETAIDALIGLSSNTDLNVRNAVVSGLKGAATNQNAKAAEALRAMGVQ